MREHSARLSLFPSPALFRPPFASLFCLVTCLFVCKSIRLLKEVPFFGKGESVDGKLDLLFFLSFVDPRLSLYLDIENFPPNFSAGIHSPDRLTLSRLFKNNLSRLFFFFLAAS
ncbi:unnamed protein product [Ixodes persulcatus]